MRWRALVEVVVFILLLEIIFWYVMSIVAGISPLVSSPTESYDTFTVLFDSLPNLSDVGFVATYDVAGWVSIDGNSIPVSGTLEYYEYRDRENNTLYIYFYLQTRDKSGREIISQETKVVIRGDKIEDEVIFWVIDIGSDGSLLPFVLNVNVSNVTLYLRMPLLVSLKDARAVAVDVALLPSVQHTIANSSSVLLEKGIIFGLRFRGFRWNMTPDLDDSLFIVCRSVPPCFMYERTVLREFYYYLRDVEIELLYVLREVKVGDAVRDQVLYKIRRFPLG